MTEVVIVNGHVLGKCAYLRSLDSPWEPADRCDCFDRLDDEGYWDEEDDRWLR